MELEGESEKQAADATCASDVLRTKMKELTKLVPQGTIPEGLFAKSIISEDMMDRVSASSSSLTALDKGREIMRGVRTAVSIDPGIFHQFCEVLADEDQQVAQTMADKLNKEYEKAKEQRSTQRKSRQGTPEPSIDLETLKERLNTYKGALETQNAPEESLHDCIKHAVQQYVDTALKLGESQETVKRNMHSLCFKEMLIPTKLRNWVKGYTFQKCDELSAIAKSNPLLPRLKPPSEALCKQPPLFNEDTLYHASICCHAVSTCTDENVLPFLRSKVCGHHLEEVSMSITEDVSRYLIARSRSTLYVALRSEPTLEAWRQKHSTFEEGLISQSDKLPLRFFVEQLWNKKRIVFTGFSFGGMLACFMAAIMWERSNLPPQVLESSVACITFGQPLLNIPFVQKVIQKFQKFETTIHSLFNKEDILPRLLRYLTIEGGRSMTTVTTSQPLQALSKEPSAATMGYHGSIASEVFQSLSGLQGGQTYSGAVTKQKQSTPTKTALSNLKGALDQILQLATVGADASPVLYGSCYLMSSKAGHGNKWSKLTKRSADQELCSLTQDSNAVKKLEATPFKWHNMEEYRHKMLTSLLEPNKYPLPTTPKVVKRVEALQPRLKAVELQEYPKEMGVALTGDNLWFCHKIVLGEGMNQHSITMRLEAEGKEITRFFISFSIIPTDQTRNMVSEDGKMKVTLYTHFANLADVKVPVKQEPYPFSVRQIQLAKQTPSEIIRLAYWSALLESHTMPGEEKSSEDTPHTPSSRFQEVATFLEEAVKIVPIESIFYALAYGDHDTAVHCAKAISECRIPIIPSEILMAGVERARIRMRTGLSARFVDHLVATALNPIPKDCLSLNFDVRNASGNKLEVVIRMVRPVFELHRAPYSDVTRSTPSRGRVQPQTSVVVPVVKSFEIRQLVVSTQVESRPEQTQFPPVVTAYFDELVKRVREQIEGNLSKGELPGILSNQNIERMYPVYPQARQSLHRRSLSSPVETLKKATKELASLAQEALAFEDGDPSVEPQTASETSNVHMLSLVRNIHEHDLKLCAALLGGFMEQQIQIPLLKSPADTAKVISSKAEPVAVGVWALFSRSYHELQNVLSRMEGNPLIVEIADYIAGVFNKKRPQTHDQRYAAKLQFLLQGINKTVSCSNQYISYSLEYQLCNNTKVAQCKSIPVRKLIDDWDKIFEGDALSLVASTHRPLIARWLKWAILIHNLREALAKFTCIGVTGLTNSGKSKLVNTLFKIPTLVGTRNVKRTTVPFMYNLNGLVDGLDVIDFPGMDARDHCVLELTQLLVRLAQVVIFVVDYRNATSSSAKAWIHALEKEDVPVLVCLTHADRLYVELMERDNIQEPTDDKRREIARELEVLHEALGRHPSRKMNFYSFYKPPDSTLTNDMLEEVRIGSVHHVGEWLVETFETRLDQKDLSERLKAFFHDM